MSMREYNKKKVRKSVLADSYLSQPVSGYDGRGKQIYNMSELIGVNGKDKSGKIHTGTINRPIFSLSIQDRIEIFERASIIQGVVTSRAKRISALNWKVQRKNYDMENLIEKLKEYKEIYDEFSGSQNVRDVVISYKMAGLLKKHLPELKFDLSNFKSALRRFKKRIERNEITESLNIKEWMKTPNANESFSKFIHKWVIDLMVHGSSAVYKDWSDGVITNFYLLPGGTIFPFRTPTVSNISAYFQIIPGLESGIYFDDEISFSSYIPNSWSSYGSVPLEALVNKIAESMLFDKRSADQADGTRPPEKAVIFENPSSLGGLTTDSFNMPMPKAEQKRIETVLNEARREAIKTLSGVGKPTVVDLSRSDTFSSQQQRQDKLLRDVAIIFNMTNMEINLAGGEFTSGKETADAQKDIEQEKGIAPIVKELESIINRDILPMKFGYDWEFKFDTELSELEQIELATKKKSSGIYSVNELREELNLDVIPDEKFDVPDGGQQGGAPQEGMGGMM